MSSSAVVPTAGGASLETRATNWLFAPVEK